MPGSLFASIAQMFERKPEWTGALGQLASNPVALAEVLVLFRMVLADGIVQPSQLTAFERICERQFGISPRDMPELHALLESPRVRLISAETFTLLGQLDTEARTALLDHMMRIAQADSNVGAGEDRLLRRTASLLGLESGARLGTEKE
ncbi:hypothetical protein IMCC20628_01055 [Hoeflea sp. IMCC20628]|uniref:tellurite resistance TerB family protein n=1 Tax=Hoeflea sp. IMCC20628 TaxID=1620421 RepID=UPI00063AB348|nr:TerB family tellurite resistance protein [Hoeflea sp. IMCC20628]AKH99772.1 hypothetical protein IMCC20628_01055 [Hoeflea sp. IMCC20628]